ncbi:hypothetical protein [Holophaga foetida]|uniref:hypothetical protein n=1 Tax=Holophaga foetida TaxID=35839 RepID=UPI0002472AB7|nr:hypothetical protein [Holophaga foetida]
MVDVITPLRLHLLQVVAKYPDIRREKLLTVKGAQAADLAYLEQCDLIRERESGCYRISHLGQMALKRGL